MSSVQKTFLVFFIGVIVSGLTIYLTPLKHVNLIEPMVDSTQAVDFYNEYQKNPDGYIFIDVRGASAYREGHAAGSVSMPLHTLFDQKSNLPKSDKEIVLICAGNRASSVGYSYLQHYGFRNLTRIEGGVEAWGAAGLPIELGN